MKNRLNFQLSIKTKIILQTLLNMLNLLKFFPDSKNRFNKSNKCITLSQVRDGDYVKVNRHFPPSTKS